jgi:transcriptional regulator of arginine metabolism
LSIDFSGQLAVVKTKPGYASANCMGYRQQNATDIILGTIAGDEHNLNWCRAKV